MLNSQRLRFLHRYTVVISLFLQVTIVRLTMINKQSLTRFIKLFYKFSWVMFPVAKLAVSHCKTGCFVKESSPASSHSPPNSSSCLLQLQQWPTVCLILSSFSRPLLQRLGVPPIIIHATASVIGGSALGGRV
jgi:hypothetical protein